MFGLKFYALINDGAGTFGISFSRDFFFSAVLSFARFVTFISATVSHIYDPRAECLAPAYDWQAVGNEGKIDGMCATCFPSTSNGKKLFIFVRTFFICCGCGLVVCKIC